MTAPVPQYPQAEYIALDTIPVNGVPAYHAGDPIFASAVERIPAAVAEGDGCNVAPVDSNEAQALLKALAKVTGDSPVPALDQLRLAIIDGPHAKAAAAAPVSAPVRGEIAEA
jgi:hypothetical protein